MERGGPVWCFRQKVRKATVCECDTGGHNKCGKSEVTRVIHDMCGNRKGRQLRVGVTQEAMQGVAHL